MLEKVQREIDGNVYVFQPLMLKPARKTFNMLVRKFGPAVAEALEGLKDADLDENMELVEALGSISTSAAGFLRGIIAGLDEKTHEDLCELFAKQTQVVVAEEGKEFALAAVRESVFGKKLSVEFEWLIFCLSAQYSDFLAPLQKAAATVVSLRVKGSVSKYPTGSTGSSTESPSATGTATA